VRPEGKGMRNTTVEEKSEALPEEILLEPAREEREGLAWWMQEYGGTPEAEAPHLSLQPSATPISQSAFNLIVFFEVTSQQTYTQKYRKPIWPKGASGVTIGIGYDVGYAGKTQLWTDWKGSIPDAMIQALEQALGVTGAAAQPLAIALGSLVDVPWDAAMSVHHKIVIPRWVALVERSLSNTRRISMDSLGALVSLTYNRGASYSKDGDRYREMRAIRQHMAASAFARVPGEIRSMKRLWPHVPGLEARREREARLFEDGLASTPSA
jgi:GH24 family phage-related lysozyme (muramidase)